MEEWQEITDAAAWDQVPTKPQAPKLDDFENPKDAEDDFGSFGEDGDQDSFADFGDFGEFNDFESSTDTQQPDSPPAIATENSSKTIIDEPKVLSGVEQVLHSARPLIDSKFGLKGENVAAVLDQCLEQALGNSVHQLVVDLDTKPIAPTLQADSKLERIISDVLSETANQNAQPEPRLLRNLILSAAATNMPELFANQLLVPLSELRVSEESNADDGDSADHGALLDIDQLRQLAAQDSGNVQLLKRALESVDLLIAAREQEISKQRDSIVAYNQVIQTLVAQASKLH
ncbi:hypothetical protein GGI07_004993 [Coemansia sp. Benny D115]|nr:hypothetical protein GGI07_004993 [Coemansia sp. Benny D115]